MRRRVAGRAAATWVVLAALSGCGADPAQVAGADASLGDGTDAAAGQGDGAAQPDGARHDDVAPAGDGAGHGDGADTSSATYTTALHKAPARCGLPAYSWLPIAQVGAVRTWEPHDVAQLTPGALKALLAQANLGDPPKGITHAVRNFRLRYTTQDKGQLVEATAVVSVPSDMGTQPAPVLLWLHGTSGWMDDCAPSKDLLGMGQAALLASFGYITVAPDFLGMRGFGDPSPKGEIHPYLIGEATAVASLDALRAAAKALAAANDLPAPDPTRLALIGPSQGGHATLMTDRYQPHYAPEWPHKAAVALVPPADILQIATGAATSLNGRSALLAAMWASMHQWYASKAPLTDVFVDQPPLHFASKVQTWLSETCDVPDLAKGVTQIHQLYNPDFTSALAAGQAPQPWQCYGAENSPVDTTVPRVRDVPILMTYASQDDLVIPEVEKLAFAKLCKQGYQLQSRQCADVGHVNGAVQVIPEALAWVEARFAGQPLAKAKACVWQPAAACSLNP